jgi:uncharacterized OB-fold protein
MITAVQFRSITPTELGLEYWERTAAGHLPLRKCSSCGAARVYLTNICRKCGSEEWTWIDAVGTGTIYASTQIHYRLSGEFPETYVLALIDLTEGVRMMANILDATIDDARIGTPVTLDFETLADGKKLPQFRIVAGHGR